MEKEKENENNVNITGGKHKTGGTSRLGLQKWGRSNKKWGGLVSNGVNCSDGFPV